jgi:pimeloyl-ACP methyl ester carboxylesterase
LNPIDDWSRRGRRHRLLDHDVFVVDAPAVRDEGGDAVLILHGFPTSSFDWRAAIDAMRTGRRVVTLDLLGYGLSDKPDLAYRLGLQADIVVELAARLGLERVALVTHDMGNSVGGEILARSLDGTLPFAVSRRVLANGSIYIDMANLTDGQKLLGSLPDEMLPEGSGVGLDAMAASLRATFAPESRVDDEEVAAMAELVVRANGSRLLPRLIRYIDERRVHERRWTGAIETHPSPLTVVWGDRDPIAVWPMVERLQTARADATVRRLDGVGHYPMVEASDQFNAALVAALAD